MTRSMLYSIATVCDWPKLWQSRLPANPVREQAHSGWRDLPAAADEPGINWNSAHTN
jgi:hypothetical protein